MDELERRLDDEDENPIIRREAALALGEAGAGARPYMPTLLRIKNNDPDPNVRAAVLQAIQEINAAPGSSPRWMLPTVFILLAVAAAGSWYWWSRLRARRFSRPIPSD